MLFLAVRTMNIPGKESDSGFATLETQSDEEAREINQDDPFMVVGIIGAEISEFSFAISRSRNLTVRPRDQFEPG
jgi:hypothetical protein